MTVVSPATGPSTADRRLMEALDKAMSLEDAALKRWLAKLTRKDPLLSASVRQILSQDGATRILMPTEPPTMERGQWMQQPERVGPYRVVQLLGMGGMGAVWRGERDDGLFEQTVAIKLMRPGLISPGAAAQFKVERRLLAKLRHPNIAQLFDGGADADGRAYFIMELIEGTPLNEYAKTWAFEPRDAARLFLPACAAVQHAHQALVVHADIKPGNILVDEEGRPKLLDFGIARNLQDLDEQAPGAGFTSGYASPERRAGEAPSPPDDIYALGVVLFELVTGATPPQDGPPPRASQAAVAGKGASGRRRGVEIGAELDAVIAKATAERPQARYDSVGALAEDIRRWIERRPVHARPMTWRRTTEMFVKRRPWIVTSSMAAVVLMVGALTAVTTLYVADKKARAMAEARFADVRGMAHYLLFDVYDKLSQTPRALPVRRDVAAVGQRYLDRLSTDGAAAPTDLRLETAEGLVRMALIQGGGRARNLGMTEAAQRNLKRAIQIGGQVAAEHPKSVQAWKVIARAQLESAILGADKESDTAASERTLAASRLALDRAMALTGGDPDLRLLEVEWRLQLSALREWQQRVPESLAAAQQALAETQRLPPALRESPDGQMILARAYDALAEITFYKGDEEGSIAPYRRQSEILEALHRADPDDPSRLRALARADWALGTTLLSRGHNAEALQQLDTGTARAARLVEFDPDDAQAQRTLRVLKFARASALSANHRQDEAVAALGELTDERLRLFKAAPTSAEAERDYTIAVAALADGLATAHRPREACVQYQLAFKQFDDMRRKGRLTPFDEGYAKRLAGVNARIVCGAGFGG